jgi:hypothetical protein
MPTDPIGLLVPVTPARAFGLTEQRQSEPSRPNWMEFNLHLATALRSVLMATVMILRWLADR